MLGGLFGQFDGDGVVPEVAALVELEQLVGFARVYGAWIVFRDDDAVVAERDAVYTI